MVKCCINYLPCRTLCMQMGRWFIVLHFGWYFSLKCDTCSGYWYQFVILGKKNNPTPPTQPHLCVCFFFCKWDTCETIRKSKIENQNLKNITYNSTTTTATTTTTTTQSSIHVQLTQPTHGATHAQNRAHVRMCVLMFSYWYDACVCAYSVSDETRRRLGPVTGWAKPSIKYYYLLHTFCPSLARSLSLSLSLFSHI